MRSRPSPFIVGSFVLAGLILAIGTILAFGSGRLFRERVRYVMYFHGAVTGLQTGAPVTFRGVKVGTVTNIIVVVGGDDQVRIPVYIELEPHSLRTHGKQGDRADTYRRIEELVAEGLRAQLQLQSLLTGQLMVQLDFFPEEPPRLSGGDLSVPELPTRQSRLQRFSESVEQIKVDQIAQRLLNALEGIDRLVNARQVHDGLTDAATVLRDLRAIVTDLKARVGPLSSEVGQTTASLRELIEQTSLRLEPLLARMEATTEETQRLVANVNRSVERLSPTVEAGIETTTRLLEHAGRQLDLEHGPAADLVRNLTRASATADRTLLQTQQTLTALQGSMGPESPLQAEVTLALDELREAARSLRSLAEYLQRHPEALLRGKGKPGRDAP